MTIQARAATGAPRRATYQDVLDAPPHKVAEIVGGALHAHPRPLPRHAVVGSYMGIEIGGPFSRGKDGPGGWWIIDEPELHFGDDILVPDIAGWRQERMPELPKTPFFTLAPDWICEILSPSTRRLDLGAKRDIYARERAAYLWLLDPDPCTLEAYKLRDGGWALIDSLAGDVQVSLPPFDAISFPLQSLCPWAG